MVVDLIDIFIILRIIDAELKKKEIRTWDIAKAYAWEDKPFTFGIDKFENNFFKKKNMSIIYRLESMQKKGIVKIKMVNGKKQYELAEGKIFLKRYKFPDNKIKDSIIIKEDKWTIYQL